MYSGDVLPTFVASSQHDTRKSDKMESFIYMEIVDLKNALMAEMAYQLTSMRK